MKKLFSVLFGGLISKNGFLSRKLLYALVAGVLAGIKAKNPDWPLPDPQIIVDILLALLGAHTLTDVAALVPVILQELRKPKV